MIPFNPFSSQKGRAWLPLFLLLLVFHSAVFASPSGRGSNGTHHKFSKRAGTLGGTRLAAEDTPSSTLINPNDPSAHDFRRTISSPVVSKDSSSTSYMPAQAQGSWSSVSVGSGLSRSDSGGSTPRSEAAFSSPRSALTGGSFGDNVMLSSKGEEEIVNADLAAPGSTFETGESSSAAEARAAAASAAEKRKNLPPPLSATSLPDGSPDTQLSNPANQHIKDSINALPPGRDTYQLVSMKDPTAPGGHQVFRYYNMADGSELRDRVPYIPDFMHDVKALEDEIRVFAGGDPEIERKLIRNLGWENGARPTVPKGEDDFARATAVDPPPPKNMWGRTKDIAKSKFNDAQWKMRTKMSDLKDTLAVGRNRQLEIYHTTGGIPAVYAREEIGFGKIIPSEARRIAQEHGEARIFYNPNHPQDQVRIVYTGPLQKPGQGPLAPESAFKTYLVPENRALPLPKQWRGEGMSRKERVQVALQKMKNFEDGDWHFDLPYRWPTKTWDPLKQRMGEKWQGARQRTQDFGQRAKGWLKGQGAGGGAQTAVEGEAGTAAQQASQAAPRRPGLGQRINTVWAKTKSALTTPRSWFNNPTAASEGAPRGGGASVGQRHNTAWQKVKGVGSTVKDKVGGLFKGGSDPAAAASGVREAVRPLRRRR